MKKIKVLRKIEREVSDIQIGDQILIHLEDFGKFTATAHKITDDGVLFIFDDYITKRQMNEKLTNKGGFKKSDLKKWLDTVLLEAFPDWLKKRIKNISIPSVGELFGHEDEWNNEHFKSDNDDQLPLMQERRNRVAYLDNKYEWGWLRNATKKEYSAAHFALVDSNGLPHSYGASNSYGVRPEFCIG